MAACRAEFCPGGSRGAPCRSLVAGDRQTLGAAQPERPRPGPGRRGAGPSGAGLGAAVVAPSPRSRHLRPGGWRRPWPRPATGHPSIGCIPPAGPVAPTGGAWSGGMAGAGCGWSPTPVGPTSCGSIWPGWVTRSWGIVSMALPAVEAPLAGCGCMPGDSTWCIPAPVSPSTLRLPCPGRVRRRCRSRCSSDLPRSPGGGLGPLSADRGVPPRWGLAGPGPRRCGAAGDRREPLGWSASPVRSGAGWARGSPPGRGGPGPWGWLELVLSCSIWSW